MGSPFLLCGVEVPHESGGAMPGLVTVALIMPRGEINRDNESHRGLVQGSAAQLLLAV